MISSKRPLRFLQVDTFYNKSLDLLYARTPGLDQQPFNVQMEEVFRDAFAAVHTLAPYLPQIGYESAWIVGNCLPAQMQWARENGAVFSPHDWLHDVVRAQIEAFRPDVFYTTDSMTFDSRFIDSLSWKPRLVIGWQASDIPAETDWHGFDIILSPLAALRATAIKLGAKAAEHFYPGFPSWLSQEISGITPDTDVVFCGQWNLDQYQRRNHLLLQVAQAAAEREGGFSCNFFLSGQQETLPPEVARLQRGERYGIAMNRALRTGRIGLDARGRIALAARPGEAMGVEIRDIACRETANMRIFETTGSGIFLLTEYHDNLSAFFELGREVETFQDERELLEKIRYYLAHPAEREAIAQRGRERCMRDHSMLKRVEALDAIIRRRLPQPATADKGSVVFGSSSTGSSTNAERREIVADDNLESVKAIAEKERFGNWTVCFRGLTICCHDLLSFYVAAKDIFLHRIYDFTTSNPNPVVIDGGGHIGLFTLFIKQKYPSSRLTVFEPDQESLDLLRMNLHVNRLSDVSVVPAGLYSTDGKISFASDHSDGSSIFSDKSTSTIDVVKLSRYLNGSVDLLKLNIEGAELDVIREIEPKLDLVDQMIMEYHGFPEVGQNLHEILGILDRNGFRYLLHDFDAETNPASKPPFHLEHDSRFFQLVYARKLFAPFSQVQNAITTAGNLEPVSRQFGYDRGTPIDRYYIEQFLGAKRRSISGHVLEIGDNSYTVRFGSNVTESSVLNAVPGENVTIVGDLSTGENIPEDTFDCIILTQTLQFIYDVKSTVRNAMKALKPGGTLLVTASGISQISRYDMDRWGDYWRFTNKSLETLLREAAPDVDAVVENFGNVAVAKAFLDGLALEDISPSILDCRDDDYQVIIAARVTKPVINNHANKNPVVLIYHRIAGLELDPQLLCVTPDNFDAHLRELARYYRIVPLYQLIDECKNDGCLPGTVSLTFDDGYLDNLTNALPLLERHKVHATIFVASGMIGSNEEFWWDAVEHIFLATSNLPEKLSFAGRRWLLNTPEEKLLCADEICSLLRDCSPEEMEQLLTELFNWSGVAREARSTHRILNHRQLQELAASPYIEIGAHSKHHVRLSRLPVHRQRIEIMTSKQQLEMVISKPVRLFSYPFGTIADFSSDTVQSVIDAGYHAAIANIQGEVSLPVDVYAIPRRLVRNWRQEVFCEWMRADDKDGLEAATINARRTTVLQALSSQTD